jgi:uncharacterized phage protein (TIGR01671 family)
MNREILFRGKRKDNGEWAYGFFSMQNLGHKFVPVILQFDTKSIIPVDVIPETVGQYTGLKDKNGMKFFDGDIFRDSIGNIAVVEWEGEGRFLGMTIERERKILYINREPIVEVIGNIHDNPELCSKEGSHNERQN